MSAVIAEVHMEEGVAQLEPRIAKIESDVGYISSRVANIEIDLRDMRKSMDQRFDATFGEFKQIRAEINTEFKSVRAEMAAESKSVRADMAAEFKSVRADMAAEFNSFRADMATEFKAVRTGSKEESMAIRAEAKKESSELHGKIEQLWRRISSLQLMIMLLGIEVLLVTKGSQVYQLIFQWLPHFK
ncbi:MAG TPA: hypothetical protein VF745_06375 [Steroidobacteraceae bacterium]